MTGVVLALLLLGTHAQWHGSRKHRRADADDLFGALLIFGVLSRRFSVAVRRSPSAAQVREPRRFEREEGRQKQAV